MATRADTAVSAADTSAPAYGAFISYSHAADGRLAPALQTGLHRFAKPWYRLRSLRVFRDETSLSADPQLWAAIERALASAGWFVLLASPDAARSEWVDREVAWWLANRGPDRLLVVLTDGELVWEDDGEGVDRARTTALPPAALDGLGVEPRWIDLRWARSAEDVSLANARFRDAVADVAATVLGRPKDELLGEDVRQHRRTKRVVRATIATLTVLLLAAAGAAAVAIDQRGRALTERDRAEAEARVALSRQLAAEAVAVGPAEADLALLLAVQAVAVENTSQARGALARTLATSGLGGFLAAPGTRAVAFAGGAVAVGGPGGVSFWSGGARGRRLALDGTVTALAVEDGLTAAGTASGAIAVWDDAGRRVFAEQAGDEVRALALAPGGTLLAGTAGGRVAVFALDGSADPIRLDGAGLVKAVDADGRTIRAGDAQGLVTIWDAAAPQREPLRLAVGGGTIGASAYDPRLTRFAFQAVSQPRPALEEIGEGGRFLELQGPSVDAFVLAFREDGRVFATGEPGRVVLWDVERGTALPEVLHGHPGRVEAVALSADGRSVAVGGAQGVTLYRLGGNPLVRTIRASGVVPSTELPQVVRGAGSAAFSPDGRLVAWAVGDVDTRRVVVWDLARDELVAETPGELVLGFDETGGVVIGSFSDEEAIRFDPASGTRGPAAAAPVRAPPLEGRPWTVTNGRGLGASLTPEGALTLWDTSRSVPLAAVPIPDATLASQLEVDPGGRRVAVVGAGGELSLVDVALASWRARACEIAGRTLTRDEWRRFVGDRPYGPACVRGG